MERLSVAKRKTLHVKYTGFISRCLSRPISMVRHASTTFEANGYNGDPTTRRL